VEFKGLLVLLVLWDLLGLREQSVKVLTNFGSHKET
jgi:hypothetical protein